MIRVLDVKIKNAPTSVARGGVGTGMNAGAGREPVVAQGGGAEGMLMWDGGGGWQRGVVWDHDVVDEGGGGGEMRPR